MEESVKQETKGNPLPPDPEISLIIPEYKADRNQLFQNLSMINSQTNFSFLKLEVIVVDDGSGEAWKIPADFYRQFHNLRTRVLECTVNGGPGVARQIGIDYAKGKYVLFADADDCLYDTNVLSSLARSIEAPENSANPMDILFTDWVEEVRTTASIVKGPDGKDVLLPDKFVQSKHENDFTWMHGKLYRRQFLVDNDIRFDDLRVHEDRRFNIIAAALSRNTRSLPILSYIWKYHSESITRAKGASYSYDSIAESVEAAARAYGELFSKHADRLDLSEFNEEKLLGEGKTNPSRGIVQTIIYTYFVAQSWIGLIDNSYLTGIEHNLASFYRSYKGIYDAYPYNFRCSDYESEFIAVAHQMGPFIEKEPLAQFLWRIAARNDGEIGGKGK
jgi:glycosyltransferase involved in cell wall biosynthesis